MTMLGPNPKVSIRLITFNHQRYIAQAIEGVLMQQTDFDYELVIGEDCSTDNTRVIALSYQRKHPEKIRVLESEKNLGMRRNGIRTLSVCRGDYIALLDGDDYWTHSRKLQQQVDWMDRNVAYTFCAHGVQIYDERTAQFTAHPHTEKIPLELELSALVYTNPLHTSSVLLRRESLPPLPEWYANLKLGDWPLYLMLAQKGPCRFFPDAWSVYRLHDLGVWSGISEINRTKATIEMLLQMGRYLGSPHIHGLRRSVSTWRHQLALLQEKSGHFSSARHQTLLAIGSAVRGVEWPEKCYFGTLLRLTVPWAWKLLCRYRKWREGTHPSQPCDT